MSPVTTLIKRRHRKKRFHIHPRALGCGFRIYDVDSVHPDPADSESVVLTLDNYLANVAKQGIWFCFKILCAICVLLAMRSIIEASSADIENCLLSFFHQ